MALIVPPRQAQKTVVCNLPDSQDAARDARSMAGTIQEKRPYVVIRSDDTFQVDRLTRPLTRLSDTTQ
jgi:hypothetical protein